MVSRPVLLGWIFIAALCHCTPSAEPRGPAIRPEQVGSVELLTDLPAGEYVGAARTEAKVLMAGDHAASAVRLLRGDSITLLGRSGAGPGEYRWLHALRSCGADTVLAYDFSLSRINHYSGDGYHGAMQLPPRLAGADFLGCIGPDQLVFAQVPDQVPGPGEHTYPQRLTLLTTRDSVSRVIGAVRGIDMYVSERFAAYYPRPFGVASLITVAGDAIVFAEDSALRLMRLFVSGTRDTLLDVPTIPRRVTEADRARYLAEQLAALPDSASRQVFRGVMEETTWGTTRPVIDALQGARDGSVWARQTPNGTDTLARWLHVRSPRAAPDTLYLPVPFRVLHADQFGLLGVMTGRDGQEHVATVTLPRGTPE